MSDERYQTAVNAVRTHYSQAKGALYRERYMDQTAGLRRIQGAIQAMQNGEQEMGRENYDSAAAQFQQALRIAPQDYAANLMMAKCQYTQKRFQEAERYAVAAQQAYPGEAQSYIVSGASNLQTRRFDAAFRDFEAYDIRLPNNPEILFLKGYAQEGAQRQPEAARYYTDYLKVVQQGAQAQHAYQRLVQWGYLRQ